MRFWVFLSLFFPVLALADRARLEFPTFDGISLNAKIYSPVSVKKLPAILVIEGSGKSSFTEEPVNSPFAQLATQLSEAGYVVLTYNKRGSGENANNGSFYRATFTTDNRDALMALTYLKSLPQVDAEKVFLLGHSFGGPHSLELALRDSVAGVVMLTSTIRKIDELQVEQTRVIMELMNVPREAIDAELTTLQQQADEVRAGKYVCSAPVCEFKDGAPVISGSLQVAWWHEVLNRDFTAIAKRVRVPILFLFGGTDVVVPETDYQYARAELRDSADVSVKWLPNLDHVMTDQTDKRASLQYMQTVKKTSNFRPISAELVREILSWLAALK